MGGIIIATKITNAALITAGRELLSYAEQTTVPYTAGGMTLAGMDCQGLVEYLLIRCGVPKADCNLAGSNAHWRKCVWTGTPEACSE
ncbi:MAG: C40 family peptidase, partial [Eubacteriales bacterium]|nr:C40 family peptidase [Eubacteriales bacterium]